RRDGEAGHHRPGTRTRAAHEALRGQDPCRRQGRHADPAQGQGRAGPERRARRRPAGRDARGRLADLPPARSSRPARRRPCELPDGGTRRPRRRADARRSGLAEDPRRLGGREAAEDQGPRGAEAEERRQGRPARAREDRRPEEAEQAQPRAARGVPEGGWMTPDHPRYMISVAAELVGMHPQTLRIYEQKGLVRPQRTAGNTRLYSDADLERLKLIQRLTSDLGLNLAGVERVLHLEDELARMHRRLDRMEREMREALQQVHRQYKRELVLYRPAQPPIRRTDI